MPYNEVDSAIEAHAPSDEGSKTLFKVLSHHSTVFSFSNKKSDIAHIEPMIIEE